MAEEITMNDVLKAAKENQKIQLIKFYRKLSGKGLKESKDIVETAEDNCKFNIDAIIELFEKYVNGKMSALKDGIECVLQNYETLGFDSIFNAVRCVIDNMEKKSN